MYRLSGITRLKCYKLKKSVHCGVNPWITGTRIVILKLITIQILKYNYKNQHKQRPEKAQKCCSVVFNSYHTNKHNNAEIRTQTTADKQWAKHEPPIPVDELQKISEVLYYNLYVSTSTYGYGDTLIAFKFWWKNFKLLPCQLLETQIS